MRFDDVASTIHQSLVLGEAADSHERARGGAGGGGAQGAMPHPNLYNEFKTERASWFNSWVLR